MKNSPISYRIFFTIIAGLEALALFGMMAYYLNS